MNALDIFFQGKWVKKKPFEAEFSFSFDVFSLLFLFMVLNYQFLKALAAKQFNPFLVPIPIAMSPSLPSSLHLAQLSWQSSTSVHPTNSIPKSAAKDAFNKTYASFL